MGARLDVGLKRVGWIRLIAENGLVRAEAIGIGYRLPRVVPISLRRAAALSAAGIPVAFRRAG